MSDEEPGDDNRQQLKDNLRRWVELAKELDDLKAGMKEVKEEMDELSGLLIDFCIEQDVPGFAAGEDKVELKRKPPKKQSVNKGHIEARLFKAFGDITSAKEAVEAIYADLELPDQEEEYTLKYKKPRAKRQKVDE